MWVITRVDDEYWRSFFQPRGGDDREEKMPYHAVQIFRYHPGGPHSPAEVRENLDIEFDWMALLTSTFTEGKRCSMKCGNVSLGMTYNCSSKSANTVAERLVGELFGRVNDCSLSKMRDVAIGIVVAQKAYGA